MSVVAWTATRQLPDGGWVATRRWDVGGHISAFGKTEMDALDSLYALLGIENR